MAAVRMHSSYVCLHHPHVAKRAKTEPAEPCPSTEPAEPCPSTEPAVTPADDAEPTPKPTPSPPPAKTPMPQPPIPSGYTGTSFFRVVRPAAPSLTPFNTSTTKLFRNQLKQFLESMRICSVICIWAPAMETVYMQIDGKSTPAIRFAMWRDSHYDEKGPGQAHRCNSAKSGLVSLKAGITSTKFNNEVQAFVHTFVADKHVHVVWYTRPRPQRRARPPGVPGGPYEWAGSGRWCRRKTAPAAAARIWHADASP
eukprot:scaffold427_cov108-Isochrysis_galbana.AAC.3